MRVIENSSGQGFKFRRAYELEGVSPTVGTASITMALGCAVVIGAAVAAGPTQVSVRTPSQPFEVKVFQLGAGPVKAGFKAVKELDIEGALPPWAVQLNWIKSETGASVSALANLFGVTRKAFYSWLAGEAEPRVERVVKIEALYELLQSIHSVEVRSAIVRLFDRQVNGESIKDIFDSAVAHTDLAERMTNAIARLDKEISGSVRRAQRAVRSGRVNADYPSC